MTLPTPIPIGPPTRPPTRAPAPQIKLPTKLLRMVLFNWFNPAILFQNNLKFGRSKKPMKKSDDDFLFN